MNFEDWLTSQNLAQPTVDRYAGAIKGSISKWAQDNNVLSRPLDQVLDPAEFASMAEQIRAITIFAEHDLRGKGMYAAALTKYAQYLQHLESERSKDSLGPFATQLEKIVSDAVETEPFVPNDEEDARERVLKEVVRRQGQRKFRADLIVAYEGCCAITRCPIRVVLEAAHVTPYLGAHTNTVSNGLLLRADIHTLWDLGLIAIAPDSMTVLVCASLQDAGYQALAGTKVFEPIDAAHRVSLHSLEQQRILFQKNAAGLE